MFIVWIAKILAALNGNTRSSEVSAGIAYGFLMALIPSGNLLWIGLFVLTFFLRINNAMFFVFLAIFSLVGRLFDPVSDVIGYTILNIDALRPVFISLANIPIVPWTHFNNSLVMGGLLLGLLCFVPVMLLGGLLIRGWRSGVRERLYNSKPVKTFLKWPIVSTLSNIFGKIFNVAKEFV